jgi:hypothetical protein
MSLVVGPSLLALSKKCYRRSRRYFLPLVSSTFPPKWQIQTPLSMPTPLFSFTLILVSLHRNEKLLLRNDQKLSCAQLKEDHEGEFTCNEATLQNEEKIVDVLPVKVNNKTVLSPIWEDPTGMDEVGELRSQIKKLTEEKHKLTEQLKIVGELRNLLQVNLENKKLKKYMAQPEAEPREIALLAVCAILECHSPSESASEHIFDLVVPSIPP